MTPGPPSFAQIDQIPANPTRILVAEDELLVALELVARLGASGYTAIGPASNGEDALRVARSSRPDMALLDMHMPRGDGITTAIRLMEELLIPTIIVSAYSDEATIARARQAGVFGYLVKPVSERQIRAAVEIAWGRFQMYIAERAAGREAAQRLEDRKVIERAKWILVHRVGVDEGRAMKLLEEHARDNRMKLLDVAHRVIQSRSTPAAGEAPEPEAGADTQPGA
ncbi:MAG: response regulator [Planctomycetota bacterium]|nr:response regulator [Planctomycetota bacterium]